MGHVVPMELVEDDVDDLSYRGTWLELRWKNEPFGLSLDRSITPIDGDLGVCPIYHDACFTDVP